jgi:hypothetical protein
VLQNHPPSPQNNLCYSLCAAAVAAAATTAGLVGHQVLAVLECIKAKLLADGGQVVPACATLYAMGVEVVTPNTLQLQQQQPISWQQQKNRDGSSGDGAAPQQQQQQQQQQQTAAVHLDVSALEQFR